MYITSGTHPSREGTICPVFSYPTVVSMLIRALCTASRSVKLRLYLVIVARCQLDTTSLLSPETRLLRRLFDYKPDYKAAVALLLDMSRLY